ncbi:hypothetical protein B0H10DRAFT_1975977 [Mycena sp. CBHHK59/15]|nr:hypothetical protein B0H10DRAFT_1975977 [Mycena sp. CBHHK59/15]
MHPARRRHRTRAVPLHPRPPPALRCFTRSPPRRTCSSGSATAARARAVPRRPARSRRRRWRCGMHGCCASRWTRERGTGAQRRRS